MQLICNDCFSGFLNQKLNREFENPFYWSRIYAKDFAKLINMYETIDFKNIRIAFNRDFSQEFDTWPGDAQSPVIICNGIRVFYNHYKYSKTDTIPRKEPPDVYYNKNYIYCVKKWFTRLQRMTQEPPVILFHWNDIINDSENDVLKVIDACKDKQYKLIFVGDREVPIYDNMAFVRVKDCRTASVEYQVDETFQEISCLIKE